MAAVKPNNLNFFSVKEERRKDHEGNYLSTAEENEAEGMQMAEALLKSFGIGEKGEPQSTVENAAENDLNKAMQEAYSVGRESIEEEEAKERKAMEEKMEAMKQAMSAKPEQEPFSQFNSDSISSPSNSADSISNVGPEEELDDEMKSAFEALKGSLDSGFPPEGTTIPSSKNLTPKPPATPAAGKSQSTETER